MEIVAIHSFLVPPEKATEDPTPVSGTSVDVTEGLSGMMQQVFEDAPAECRYSICFSPAEDGSQQNNCRDLLLAYIRAPSMDTGREVAQRLRDVTTERSGRGLLFLILGKAGSTYRLVVSRFPADQGILAHEDRTSLSVQYIEQIFMRSATSYKCAMYEGNSFDEDFWVGSAIDKQINSAIVISTYWIQDFLLSDFATTGERGTRQLADALSLRFNYAVGKGCGQVSVSA